MSAVTSTSFPLARVAMEREPASRPARRFREYRRWLPIAIPGAVLLTIVLASILAPWIAPYDPNALDMKAAMSGPTAAHWLGTDQLGRDQLSRLLYGGRSTLFVSGIGVAGVVGIGLIIGTIAGYLGGRIDLAVSAVVTVLLALPTLLLTLAILGILGPGTSTLMIALIGAGWVGHARIFRASVIALRERPYIEAAQSLGASRARILRLHIWPNLFTQIVVLATLDIGALILTVSSLSFLGLGVQPPTADWGTMLNEARPFVGQLPLLAIAPGICISLVALASNMLGDALRDVVDIGRKTH
jgi:ABC-type dipeptide/oligopeptide/nickel transport system permease subunit